MKLVDKLLATGSVAALVVLSGGLYLRFIDQRSPHSWLGSRAHHVGAQRYVQFHCHTCHGADGRSPTSTAYPAVSGQSPQYTAAQIKEIRDGKRRNGLSGIMAQQIGNLSDENAEAIALYLSSLPR